jgi:diaminohydroxyphosphoribosylaminopyrimidine deaminase/5-amino-6-(5-phosphoribosylamino)uracil reductase
VLVQHGKVVATGYHLTDGEGHAEANALARLSSESLNSADNGESAITAYVTLEPCSFQGRTPSCAHALVAAGVTRVVYAMTDPHHENQGKGLDVLRAAGIKVDGPLLEASAKVLNPGHIKKYAEGLPFVRLKLAMTLDGKTALKNGKSQWITGPEARRDVQKLRARSSAIVTGVQTIIDDDPELTVRAKELDVEFAELSAKVARRIVILDSKLRISAGAKVLANPEATIVCVNNNPDVGKTTALGDGKYLGTELWGTKANAEGRVDLRSVLQQLARTGANEVLFECGATLAGSLIKAQLVDELVIYTAPKLMGNEAKSLLNFTSPDNMRDLVELEIQDVRQLGRDVRTIARIRSHSR